MVFWQKKTGKRGVMEERNWGKKGNLSVFFKMSCAKEKLQRLGGIPRASVEEEIRGK